MHSSRFLLLIALASMLPACGSGFPRRGDYLVTDPSPVRSVGISYTSTVRLGRDRIAAGLVRVTSHTDSAQDLEVLCIAMPERDGIIPDEVVAVLRSEPMHVEPHATTELADVFFEQAPPSSPGPYDVQCGVRPVGGTGLFTFPGIANGALQSFHMRQPDLRLGVASSTADVYDCETHALPVRGRPICVQPVAAGGELHTEMLMPELDQHTVRCELGGQVAEITVDTAVLSNGAVLRFEHTAELAAGPTDVVCTIDPDGVLAESDETNNTVRLTIPVLDSQSGWASAIVVVPAEVTATYRHASGETGSPASRDFRFPFVLEGHPIRAATASCTSADGLISAAGAFGMGGLPENILQPGEHSVSVTLASAGEQSPADVVLTCTLAVTDPQVVAVTVTGAAITVHIRR